MEPITELPQGCHCITAAVLDKTIILSGYEMKCCYSYNDSAFTSILTLPADTYKFVCEGWIYTNNTISWNDYLFINCAFKKNQYIFFIDRTNLLLRIDTALKRVEKVAFT